MKSKPCLIVDHIVDDANRAHVYTLAGKLMGEGVCYDFLELVREELDEDHAHVVIDMRDVKWANSSGIGILAAIYTSARKHEGRVSLVNVADKVGILIEVSGLDNFLHLCDSVDEALARHS
jgi:anti-anti-sigma factor